MDAFADRVHVLQAESERIKQYLHALPLEALSKPSACTQWQVQEVIAHRGTTNRNAECTPGYYNFEGEFNRRQDGNYNGGFPAYAGHMASVREHMEDNFEFS